MPGGAGGGRGAASPVRAAAEEPARAAAPPCRAHLAPVPSPVATAGAALKLGSPTMAVVDSSAGAMGGDAALARARVGAADSWTHSGNSGTEVDLGVPPLRSPAAGLALSQGVGSLRSPALERTPSKASYLSLRRSGRLPSSGSSSAGDLMRRACMHGKFTRAAPLMLFLLTIAMTAVITGNEASTRLAARRSAELEQWRATVTERVSESLAHKLFAPARALDAVRLNMMWLREDELDDVGVKIDPWLNSFRLRYPASTGVVASLFARRVKHTNLQSAGQRLSQLYERNITARTTTRTPSEEELADPVTRAAWDRGEALMLTHVLPPSLAAAIGGDMYSMPLLTRLVEHLSKGQAPLATYPLRADENLMAGVAADYADSDIDFGSAVLVALPVHRPSDAMAATMRGAAASDEEVATAYASGTFDIDSLVGTLLYMVVPSALFSTTLGPGALNTTATAHSSELLNPRTIVYDHASGAPTTVSMVVEDVSDATGHRITENQLENVGWLSETDLDDYEAARRRCGSGGTLVWASLGADQHAEACEQIHASAADARVIVPFNFFGRVWVFHVAAEDTTSMLDKSDQDVIASMWGVGITVGIMVLLIGAYAVEHLLERTEEEKEFGRRRAAEAARLAHEETVSYACHELRNPLHVVSATADFLESDLRALRSSLHLPADSATVLDTALTDIGTIVKSGRLMRTVVDDLLDYARLRRGQLDIVPTDVPVRSLVRSLISSHRSMAAVDILADISDDVPEECYLDELRLRQVWQNGITNACKYTTTGSITLKVSLASDAAGSARVVAAHVHSRSESVSCDAPSSTTSRSSRADLLFVKFEVLDTGPGLRGVDPEVLFKPFEQGEGARQLRRDDATARKSRSKAGTGLGLAIAYQLVELMGGKIGLQNRTDCSGTRYWFTLPTCNASRATPTAAMTSDTVAAGESSLSNASSNVGSRSGLVTVGPSQVVTSSQVPGQLVTSPKESKAGWDGAAPSVGAAGTLQGLQVLVVDDERLNRRVAKRFIAKLGANASELEDGDEVEPFLKQHYPDAMAPPTLLPAAGGDTLDVILMDIQMKRSRGDHVFSDLRAKGLRVPVVACTGNAGAHDVSNYRSLGFAAVLTKPFSLTDLSNVLQRAVLLGGGIGD